MQEPKNSGINLEIGIMLAVFCAAFLLSQWAVTRTGNVWWGVLTGSCAFLGIFYILITLGNRFSANTGGRRLSYNRAPDTAAGAPYPDGIELACFLVIFLAGYGAARYVAVRTGTLWWGVLAGAVAVTAILAGLIRLAAWLQTVTSGPSPSSPAPSGKEFAWVEPKSFRAAELEDVGKWVFNMIFFIFGCAVVCLWLANRFMLGAEVTQKLLVTAGGIIVYFLALLGFTRLLQITVRITDKAIIRDLTDSSEVYKFPEIEHCEIGKVLAGGNIYAVLITALKNGDREIFCLDPSVSNDLLRGVLEQRGLIVVMRSDISSLEALDRQAGDDSLPSSLI